MTFPTRCPRREWLVAALVSLALALTLFATAPQAADAISPKRVVATKFNGVKKIAGLRVNRGPVRIGTAKRRLGKPVRIKRGPSTCEARYSGLTLLFTSFGTSSSCRDLFLQTATIHRHAWKVRVGQKVYRVGQSRRRIPGNARRFPGFGFQLASMPFIGSRSGSVFAQVGSRTNRISKILLFIGGAGD